MPARLGKAFFDRSTAVVARELLGKVLVHGKRRGVIVETEAYLNKDDLAAHYVQGKRRAIEAYARGPGAIYIHPMRAFVGIDIVAGDGSVLLRAVDLPKADGPGKLTREMGISYDLHTLLVTDPACPLAVEEGVAAGEVLVGTRVGISKSVAHELRFRLVK